MKVLMKGNEAVAEAAIKAGCRLYFAYPITPQSELIEYMSRKLPLCNGRFIQAESELAAINMVYGAAASGRRVMTSSSSPGISLKMEGLSYIAGANLPMVVVNVQRGGPGLGDIQPSQGDYFQATKGGGHGDYRLIVFAPCSVQESADLIEKAFNLADKYRNPTMILTDGLIGQMMEPVEFKDDLTSFQLEELDSQHLTWCLSPNLTKREKHVIKAFEIDPKNLEKQVENQKLKYDQIEKNEVMFEEFNINSDNQYLIVAFGIAARIAKSAIENMKKKGVNIGLIRPITLWPFPTQKIKSLTDKKIKKVFVLELNLGQMVEDVRLAIEGKVPIEFYGRTGGMVFTPFDIEKFVFVHTQGGGK